jgi:hypothetical protein
MAWLMNAARDGHDFHWHSLSADLWERAIAAAGVLGGRSVQKIVSWAPWHEGPYVPAGEVIFVYRLGTKGAIEGFPEIRLELEEIHAKIERAQKILGNVLQSKSSRLGSFLKL